MLGLLKEEMGARMPGLLKAGTGGVTGMPPKAYRLVFSYPLFDDAEGAEPLKHILRVCLLLGSSNFC